MKNLLMITIFLVFCFSVNGQKQGDTDIGIKAGANVSTLTGEATDDHDVSSRTAFNAGLLMRYFLLSNLAFQPELLYGGHGGKESFNNNLSTYRFSSLFLPLLFNYYISSFYLTGGPTLSYLLSAQVKSMGNTTNYIDNYKRFNFALAFGLGYMISNSFGLDARYNFGLNDINEQSGGAALKNNILMFSLFFLFNRK